MLHMSQPLQHASPVWTLGDLMWKARKDAGLDQSEVAAALNVSRSLVGKWENDKSTPNVRQVVRFAELTKFDPYWLVETLKTRSEKSTKSRSRHLSKISDNPAPKPGKLAGLRPLLDVVTVSTPC